MKQSKKLTVILAVIWMLLLAAEVLTVLTVLRLGMIPGKFMVLLAALLLALWLLTGFLLLWPQKKTGNVRRAIGCVLAALTVAGCAAITTVVSDVDRTMTNITRPAATGVTMAVYVREDDPAQTLTDAAGYTIGIVEGYEQARTEQALAAIAGNLGQDVKTAVYGSVHEMVDALYAREVDAIILNSAYVTILADLDGYTDFGERTRIICEIPVAEYFKTEPEKETAATDPEQPDETKPVEPKNITNTPFVVYISGSDTRSQKLITGNSDVNILVVVNPQTKQILLLNTPRDYYIPNPAGSGALDKLTHCGVYGIDCSIEALEDLYDVSVDYYAQINFTGFETLIDAIGGVTVYSNVSFSNGGVSIQVGENYLNGSQALAFARERYQLAAGDNDRGKNQMKVIQAAIEKVTSGPTIITKYGDILDSLEGMFATNVERSEINDLVKMQLSDMASWNISTFAVTGAGDSRITYSIPGLYVYVMHPNDKLVAQASELIDRVIAGESLTGEDVKPKG